MFVGASSWTEGNREEREFSRQVESSPNCDFCQNFHPWGLAWIPSGTGEWGGERDGWGEVRSDLDSQRDLQACQSPDGAGHQWA